ncbi:MAG: DedA family protein [Deltaproteobacteria bacterium]|nr:DedA family protein [Deltaproteobacteria bacterium]MBW2503645.1 DedA family protein [Deltaproteobacteria bacterium]MBW2520566.1 DedA family protein [Deltaproteobacteria bacterium]
MDEWLLANGYIALFILSFLAATLLPLGSEWMLVLLLVNQHDPAASVVVATLGNSLGALTTYLLGLWGGPLLWQRLLRIDDSQRQKAERIYTRFGSWSLLFAWIPIIGDPLCLVGGLFKVGWARFLILVSLGKAARYLAIAATVVNFGSSPV